MQSHFPLSQIRDGTHDREVQVGCLPVGLKLHVAPSMQRTDIKSSISEGSPLMSTYGSVVSEPAHGPQVLGLCQQAVEQ